ncbi:MAG TPA: hypothetical protein VMM58_12675 [Bacteroidota bacterium]|nr:hypothetical protein [Bacteroidota bacterium]
MRTLTASFFVASFFLLVQTSLAQGPDAVVIVRGTTLNGFLTAVGPVSGKAPYNVLGMKGEYTWTVQNARIALAPNQAHFIADASVKVGPFSYGSVANGDVEIQYHQPTNRISVKVLTATFEVYTKIFGKKIHLGDVDVSKFYRPEFEFAGPQPVQPNVLVTLPGDQSKTVYITPVGQNLKIEQDQIVVTSNLVFSDRPPSK